MHTIHVCRSSSPTLDKWYEESQEIELTRYGQVQAGKGLRAAKPRLRIFPELSSGGIESPPLEVLRFEGTAGLTLEAFSEWMVQTDRALGGRVYLLAELELDDAGLAADRVGNVLSYACLGDLAPLNGAREIVLFNRRAIALRTPEGIGAGEGSGSEAHDLLEVLLYTAYIVETLFEFSKGIVDAVERRRVKGGRKLRSAYLVFQARYIHPEPFRDRVLQDVFHGIAAQLGLEGLKNKVEAEVQILEQIERDQSAQVVEVLLALVGIGGIVQSVAIDWSALNLWQMTLIPTLLLGFSAAVLWHWQRSAGGLAVRIRGVPTAGKHNKQ